MVDTIRFRKEPVKEPQPAKVMPLEHFSDEVLASLHNIAIETYNDGISQKIMNELYRRRKATEHCAVCGKTEGCTQECEWMPQKFIEHNGWKKLIEECMSFEFSSY